MSDLKKDYDSKVGLFDQLKKEVVFTIEESLDIKIHDINARVKEFSSFLDKTKRHDYQNPFEDINDIVGVRIVCLF